MVQTVLVAHITARLLELRPGLSVIKDDGGGGDEAVSCSRTKGTIKFGPVLGEGSGF